MSSLLCACGRPVDGRTLCSRCVHTTDVAIANIAMYYADLELTATRQKAMRYDLPRGKGGSKMPMLVDFRFLPDGRGKDGDLPGVGHEARQAARNQVTTWVRVCLEHWPPLAVPVCTEPDCRRCKPIRADARQRAHPRDTVASCCAYLQRMLPKIAVSRWAEEFKREMLELEKTLLRVDARGPERIYAGECTICLAVYQHSPLYALPGDEWVKCPAPDCGMEYLIEERRVWMHDVLEYQWLTAAEIADQATYLKLIENREWARKKLNRWHADGFLKAASVNDRGEPLFPYGDASRLLVSAESRKQADTRKRA